MKKVLAFAVMGLALSVFSCGDTGVGVGDGTGGDGGGGPSGYTLTTSVYPSNGGSVSRSPNQTSYTSGTPVTVTASPAQGYTFTKWSGASSSTSTSVTVYMYSNQTLTANFNQASNAVVITLTDWSMKETDLLGDTKLDPKISFDVIAVKNGSIVSNNSTGALLDRDNVGQSWSGYAVSSPVPFISSADEIRIKPVVIEKDPLASDDISPRSYDYWSPIPSAGSSGYSTIGTVSTGTSQISYRYEFIWQ
ncbi:hypothetical protein R80B4_02536 [Fibrobacteres bacterium R8-0-B4]